MPLSSRPLQHAVAKQGNIQKLSLDNNILKCPYKRHIPKLCSEN